MNPWILKMRLLLLCCVIFHFSLAVAQSIDVGRGALALTVPANYQAATATPLVVLLHGYGSSGSAQDAYLGLGRLANQYGFIFVAPDGTFDTTGRRFWNATPACCDFFSRNADDSAYIAAIINTIRSRYNIDSRRVYLVGHSNGGFMSYQFAHTHSQTIAAIVSLAGASHKEERAAPTSPVHVLQIHGTADTTIFYAGGSNVGQDYPGAVESVTRWAAYNACSIAGKAGSSRDLVNNLTGNETTTVTFSSGCKTGGSAELWAMNSAPHIPIISTTFAAQVVEWLYDHPKSEWPSLYSGVTPASALSLNLNNIGIYHTADVMIYSCVGIFTNGLPAAVNGVTKFDIGFGVVSASNGTIRVFKSRPFNPANALDQTGASPDCSGKFETTTSVYTDIIQVGAQTLRVSFALTNPENLQFTLITISE